jgi:hypothetical protein
MDFYYDRISKRIGDLLLAVVALGLLLVSVEYIRFAQNYPEAVGNQEFWKRTIFTVLVIIFSSYNFIAYAAYFNVEKKTRPLLNPVRLIFLYLTDLAQVTLTAWLYSIVLIGNITSAGSSPAAIEVGVDTFIYLFFFMLLWHLIVIGWYALSKGPRAAMLLHARFAAAYFIASAVLFLFDFPAYSNLIEWLCIIFYAVLIFAIYWIYAIPLLSDAQLKYLDQSA